MQAGGREFDSHWVHQCWCGSTVEQLICNQQVGGSIPSTSSKYWTVAQMVEHAAVNRAVVGSIPTRSARLPYSLCLRLSGSAHYLTRSSVKSVSAADEVFSEHRVICRGDGIGIHTGLKILVLRVRLPPSTPIK